MAGRRKAEIPELVSQTWLTRHLGVSYGAVYQWLDRYSDVRVQYFGHILVEPPPEPLLVDGKRPVWRGDQVLDWECWVERVLPLLRGKGCCP